MAGKPATAFPNFMNPTKAIDIIQSQNAAIAKQVAGVEERLSDYIWKMGVNGSLSDYKTNILENKIKSLKAWLARNQIRLAKLQETSSGPSCGPRDRYVTSPHIPTAQELAEDKAEQDLQVKYEEFLRKRNTN